MPIAARNDADVDPGAADIRAALERVIASPNFRASPRLASFLRFVVEETLAGNANRIKGYSVAVGALGRSDTFDPQTDPIVRVEASRLRRALEQYYVGVGRYDTIVIDLRRGSYIPTFRRRRISRGLNGSAIYCLQVIRRVAQKRSRRIALVACVALAVSGVFWLESMSDVAVTGSTAPVDSRSSPNWTALVALFIATIIFVIVERWISRH